MIGDLKAQSVPIAKEFLSCFKTAIFRHFFAVHSEWLAGGQLVTM